MNCRDAEKIKGVGVMLAEGTRLEIMPNRCYGPLDNGTRKCAE